MDTKSVIYGICLFFIMHVMVWWATNAQFIREEYRDKAIYISIILAIPCTLSAFYASGLIYDGLNETAWSVRFIGFGTSYLVFPILTWLFLKESMFNVKTLICIALSFLIVSIQLFWKQ